MVKKKDNKIIIWIIIIVIAFLILNGNIDLGLFSVSPSLSEPSIGVKSIPGGMGVSP